MTHQRVTYTLCLVEVLALVGIATFPALLPTFIGEWRLSNTDAGWITAVYYAGYMVSVPVLVSVTDRLDARRVVLLGTLGGTISALGFALFATGFWTAVLFRLLSGISLAGIYMPGLKLLGDHTEGTLQSRYVSFYTASFSIGLSLSYLIAGEVNTRFGWRWAFAIAALFALCALLTAVRFLPSGATRAAPATAGRWFDFKPVLDAGNALAYIFGYAAHMWELFSLRSWIVAFLTFSQGLQPASSFSISATRVAFLIGLIGLPASIAGNEMARMYGRKKIIMLIMSVSALLCSVIGFCASLPSAVVIGLCLVSSQMKVAWGMGYLTMAAGCALGPVFLVFFGRREARSAVRRPMV